MRFVNEFFADDSGATLVEYGVALIVAIVVGASGLNTLADGAGFNMASACSSTVTPGTATNQTC